MKNFLFVLLCFASGLLMDVNAQLNFERSNEVQFIANAKTLELPTFGGLNYAQFSDMDIDFDGDLDLVIFDRTNNNIQVLRNELVNNVRKYIPFENGRFLFPSDVIYRLQLYDYNNDGKKDLFTYQIGGMKVYQNTGSASNGLTWTLAKNLLYSKYTSNSSNLYVSLLDIPALVDVEGDGDMDILSFNIGGSHLEYHQNQSMDIYGHADSLVFELKNECWGKFSEDANNSTIVLNDPNSPCTGGGVSNPEFDGNTSRGGQHSGSTVLALDFNNDQVMDLILGDLSSKAMVKLLNGGTAPNTNSAMVSVEYNFPQNSQSVSLDAFPAAFYLDVDFDGKKDLIVGANAKNISENVNSIWFYKNTGTNQAPNFSYQQNDFLQSEMIDVGTGSIPVFFDQNNDGKEDLLLANFFQYLPISPNKESNINVFRNTSAVGNSSFTFADDDFLNLSAENLGLRMIPSFGDLNGDGKKDLLLSLENGTFRIRYNTSTSGNASFSSSVGTIKDAQNNEINEGNYPTGQLFDLNNDGKLDLIVGRKDGTICYYENTGSTSTPQFTKANDQLGGIDISGSLPDGYATPHFFRHNGKTELFLGSLQGKLAYFRDIDGNISTGDVFEFYSDNFLNIDVKGYSSFYVNDLDNDAFLDLWIGTDLGGLYHYEVDPNSTSDLEEKVISDFLIFPNPTKGIFEISNASEIQTLQINSLTGATVDFDSMVEDNKLKITLKNPIKGIYFISILTRTGTSTRKLVLD